LTRAKRRQPSASSFTPAASTGPVKFMRVPPQWTG
jgi:hypothetical protein